MNTWPQKIAIFACIIIGTLLCTKAIWIHAKAMLAQVLLKQAWEQTIVQKQPVKPWPWADTWPVARLLSPEEKQDMIVLASQNGATLAFGPGMLQAGAKPGQPGTCILAGHRDTSFSFLQNLQLGDTIILEDNTGVRWRYKVSSTTVRQADELYLKQSSLAQLALITCYPFNAIRPGTSQRYLVLADKV